MRNLGIPTTLDRFLQQAVMQARKKSLSNISGVPGSGFED
jgi:retron-type reverse transcriptase